MGHARATLWATGVLTACALAASLVGAASASAASTGFYIHNLTSTPLKLSRVEWNGNPDRSDTAVPPPKVGELLVPGAPDRHIEIELIDYQHMSSVHLTYQRTGALGPDGTIELTLYDNDPAHPGYRGNRTVKCDVPRNVVCEANVPGDRDQVRLLDPVGTGATVKADDPRKQAEVLRTLCTRESVAADAVECDFSPNASHEYGPPHLVGHPFVNCDEAGIKTGLIKYSESVGVTNSLGIERGAETETIFERAKANAKYRQGGYEWNDEQTFRDEVPIETVHGFLSWYEARHPVIRHAGKFYLDLGNTRWVLDDVHFETPDPLRKTLYDPMDEYMTPERRDELCNASEGLVRAPARYATIKQRGTRRADALYGGRESTTVIARAGGDIVRGASGDDRLFGGPGRDLLVGGPGSDTIVDRRGRTSVRTGGGGHSGSDSVNVRDGRGNDRVTCGNRQAAVKADPGDRVRHCGR